MFDICFFIFNTGVQCSAFLGILIMFLGLPVLELLTGWFAFCLGMLDVNEIAMAQSNYL